jgi:hypothetical protein
MVAKTTPAGGAGGVKRARADEDEGEDVYDIVVVCDDDASWCSQSLRGFELEKTVLVKRKRWGDKTEEEKVAWLLAPPDTTIDVYGGPPGWYHTRPKWWEAESVHNLTDCEESYWNGGEQRAALAS